MQNASEKFDTLIYPILIDLTELIGVLTIKILDLYYDVIPAYWQEFYFLVWQQSIYYIDVTYLIV